MEALQKFTDPPIANANCARQIMKKLISQSTFHLKGTGWYVTDYASKSGGNQGASAQRLIRILRPSQKVPQRLRKNRNPLQRVPPKLPRKRIPRISEKMTQMK